MNVPDKIKTVFSVGCDTPTAFHQCTWMILQHLFQMDILLFQHIFNGTDSCHYVSGFATWFMYIWGRKCYTAPLMYTLTTWKYKCRQLCRDRVYGSRCGYKQTALWVHLSCKVYLSTQKSTIKRYYYYDYYDDQEYITQKTLPIPVGLYPSPALECDVSSFLVRLHDVWHQKNQTHHLSGQPPAQPLILKGHWTHPETEKHDVSQTE